MTDKDYIQRKVKNDKQILSLMGLTGQTAAEIAKRIIKRSQWDDIQTNEKRICIYFRPSRTSRNEILTEDILQIDCHVPAKQDYIADDLIDRLKELLKKEQVNGKPLRCIGQLGELPTMAGFYCAGIRFNYYNPI